MTESWAVDLTNVEKTYKGGVPALRGVDMRCRQGEVFGLLGPNGAGKSTLVKILMTVISATKAEGSVLGNPVGHKPTLARVGYLPEHHKFPEYLTGAQVIDFFGCLAGVERSERKRRTEELLELVGMKEWGNTRIKQYSKGMRQRVGIAQALVNDPDLVVLDEPTDGVDPVGRKEIRDVLLTIKQRGKTVLLNSHLLSELEMVCDRVAILVKGQVKSQGTIDELTASRRFYEIEVEEANPQNGMGLLTHALPGAAPAAPEPQTALKTPAAAPMVRLTMPDGTWAKITGNVLQVGTDEPRAVQPILDAIRAKGGTIRNVKQVRPSLEDLFMEAVVDPNTGKAMAPGAVNSGKKTMLDALTGGGQ